MNSTTTEPNFKRNVAYKLRIGEILSGKPVIEGERIKFLEVSNKQVVRANIIANITDKYIQEGEKKFASVTLDDATGQIKLKAFGEDVEKFTNLSQGDTVLVIGLVRSWNNEVYLTPEIIKKKEPAFLLIRKYESEKDTPKVQDKTQISALKERITQMLRDAEKSGGIEIEHMIMNIKDHSADVINQEIRKILEDGIAYEPRPGKLRYLG